ncbi:energy transducer TonB [Mucilaginibacter antarcticus]|uniref:energy transducer TonB n=1 Tax=Mucilaginibacter antarcticus TaxID=1855725 RepID=UPI0036280388
MFENTIPILVQLYSLIMVSVYRSIRLLLVCVSATIFSATQDVRAGGRSFLSHDILLTEINVSPGDSIYTKADKPPMYPYGLDMFLQYIGNNIKYRDIDVVDPLQRKVIVSFVVEPDGAVSNAKAIQGTNDSLKNEAVRVVMASPKWEPGYVAGKAVRVAYTVPVPFGKAALHEGYTDEIFTVVSRQPFFPGGDEAFTKFIDQNRHYAKTDSLNKTQGKVVVECVVEKTEH